MDNDVLRQAPLFSSLDDEAAAALGDSMSETTLRRGDVLFHEGDSGDRLYVVTEGKVKVELALARGKQAHDKRQDLARRDAEREVSRALGRRAKGMT